MRRAVLIMSALPQEIAALRSLMSGIESVEVGGRQFHRGVIDTHNVVLTTVGIGKVNAAMVTTLALSQFEFRAVLFTGVAGSLDEAVGIGDVVVGERVVPHDTGVLGSAGLDRYQSGHVAFLNPTDRFGYTAPREFVDRLRESLSDFRPVPVLDREPRVIFGTIATGDQFVNDEGVRRDLHVDLGARAVEMEGAAVAQIAEHFEVPCLVIRSVSDLAGSESEIDFVRFVDEVTVNSVAVIRIVLGLL
ncbi:MAG: 5'-methylthioadenosine/adenosylhomocysteine nucleosidase [Actinomycetota bacterium]|nr:5'-methylthioadenosine/adenosylhomocysteine nucleosidase [Actinomycetota bacterium]